MFFEKKCFWRGNNPVTGLFALCLLIESTLSYAETQQPLAAREYQVKAVFLYNFARLTTYPKLIFNKTDTPFHLCIAGEDPFQMKLDIAVRDAKIQDHPVVVQRLQESLADVEHCEVLFISLSEKEQFENILRRARQYPILTVSEIEDFVIRGGMIQFYNTEDNVRFLVDPETITEAGLKASSRFLEIAKIVRRDR
ncbi:MAG: hypothetical protein BWK79_00010 [Beggiatoa sp. IS2]|nr:MAG: hypothetical protein BWK79_00010 [Beggiatoa sp. IS2]